jgi:hypothetical protein
MEDRFDPTSVTTTHALTGEWTTGHPDVGVLITEHFAGPSLTS